MTTKEIVLNLVFWGVTGWILLSGFSIESQEIELIDGVKKTRVFRSQSLIIQLSVQLVIAFILYYVQLLNMNSLGRDAKRNRILVNSVVIFVLAVGLAYTVDFFYRYRGGLPLPASIRFGVPVFYLAVATAYGSGKAWWHAEKRRREQELDARNAQLELLRNQLQPHFLFNALNNLLSLVDQERDPKLALAFEKLSSLLRYVIHAPESGSRSVKDEIGFLRNYALLQTMRYEEDEVEISWKVNGDCEAVAIEPGLLLPFVENAFKHGTAPEEKSKIQISCICEKNGVFRFSVSNPVFPGLSPVTGTGTGLEASRQRLQLLYPGKHELEISSGDQFIVQLTIHEL